MSDKLGCVVQRTQHWETTGFVEQFDYDELNRLTLSKIGGVEKKFTYDDLGNVMSRTGVGSGDYVYPVSGTGAVRPHAVQSIRA